MRVLLIDDDMNVRNVVSKMLRRAGFAVVEGENGLRGVTLLKANPVDLVLTDMVMPVMDGIEFIKTARQLNPLLKVIAMSGGGRTCNMDHLQAAREVGACATLQKPFTSRDLLSSIQQCLAGGA